MAIGFVGTDDFILKNKIDMRVYTLEGKSESMISKMLFEARNPSRNPQK